MKKVFAFALIICCTVTCMSQSLSDTVRLTAFMDGVITTHMRDKHIAGATVSIVQNGKVLLAKGYGFADVKKRQPVDPGTTLFRIGSISKMFTWISVMQLVAQGKISLDADVNSYFKDFKIPDAFGKPVTLNDIMTHTPGFEDLVIGLFGKDSTSMKSFAEIFSKEMPERVRPPHTYSSYSNHGTGMAAYIVEQVSGMSFNDYVEKNILGPLNMTHTTFRQPLPANLKNDMSKGYKFTGGEFKPESFEYVPLYPVGAASASATDMVKFMDAILAGGSVILDSATLHLMEQPAHRHHPDVNPMRHGFMDLSQNGVTIIGHGGDTFWFHSVMALFPETKTGLFVSFNTDKGGGTYLDVLSQFADAYYPDKNALKPPIKVDRKFLERFAGFYRGNRYVYHDMTKISSLFNDMAITVPDSSRIKVTAGENVKYYVPIDSLTFREENSSKVIAFDKDDKGKISHLFLGGIPIIAFDKVGGVQSMSFHSMVFILTIVMGSIVLVYWPVAASVRRGYQSVRNTIVLPGGAKWVAWLDFFLLITFYVAMAAMLSDPTSIVFGVTTPVKILMVLPLISSVLTLIMVINAFRLSGDRRFSLMGRLFYVLITLVSIAGIWQLYYWNLLGFNY
ncbi:MAG TPA: serine hydrolase domain-containing protein [Cyclobacteriaceae bacterium]|nr:serine hydrolase domain-containing protein [Cyclobacteriaceae bacterium]